MNPDEIRLPEENTNRRTHNATTNVVLSNHDPGPGLGHVPYLGDRRAVGDARCYAHQHSPRRRQGPAPVVLLGLYAFPCPLGISSACFSARDNPGASMPKI